MHPLMIVLLILASIVVVIAATMSIMAPKSTPTSTLAPVQVRPVGTTTAWCFAQNSWWMAKISDDGMFVELSKLNGYWRPIAQGKAAYSVIGAFEAAGPNKGPAILMDRSGAQQLLVLSKDKKKLVNPGPPLITTDPSYYGPPDPNDL